MNSVPSFGRYFSSALLLMLIGWGGLGLLLFILQLPPLVWARWAFFALWFTALSGTALPFSYFMNRRFSSNPPSESNAIIRPALWVGVYGATLAWLQLGHLVNLWVWMGLAGGLITIEYLIRMRERSRWRPPLNDDYDQSPDTSFD